MISLPLAKSGLLQQEMGLAGAFPDGETLKSTPGRGQDQCRVSFTISVRGGTMSRTYQNRCLRAARQTLLRGGVIAYPTEAVYGLGCLPEHGAAVARILALKRRPAGKKGLILVAASLSQVARYLEFDAVRDWRPILASWPGPVSWVFPATRALPPCLRGEDHSIAIRITALALLRTLCRTSGPLVSTSANPSGRISARSASQVRRYFASQPDYIYPGHIPGQAGPSELRCAISQRVLRPATGDGA